MTEPKKFCDEESDPIWWINREVEETLECLEEDYLDLYKLELLRDNWNKCHMQVERDGKHVERAVTIPPEIGSIWDRAYLDGDFIDPVFPNGEDIPDD